MKKEILKILIYIVMTLSLNAYGVETLLPAVSSEKIIKLIEKQAEEKTERQTENMEEE